MKIRKQYFGLIELFVGLALIIVALIPLALSFGKEGQCLRGMYYHSVAEQILDGKREVLVAGGWKKYPMGISTLTIKDKTFQNLPKGKVKLNLEKLKDHKIKVILTWKPDKFKGVGEIRKEAIFNEKN